MVKPHSVTGQQCFLGHSPKRQGTPGQTRGEPPRPAQVARGHEVSQWGHPGITSCMGGGRQISRKGSFKVIQGKKKKNHLGIHFRSLMRQERERDFWISRVRTNLTEMSESWVSDSIGNLFKFNASDKSRANELFCCVFVLRKPLGDNFLISLLNLNFPCEQTITGTPWCHYTTITYQIQCWGFCMSYI